MTWIAWKYLGEDIRPASSQVFLLTLKVRMVLRLIHDESRPPVNNRFRLVSLVKIMRIITKNVDFALKSILGRAV